MVIVQKKDRIATYLKPRTERDKVTVAYTNEMMYSLGFDYQVSTTMPINDFLKGADVAQAFLSQVKKKKNTQKHIVNNININNIHNLPTN